MVFSQRFAFLRHLLHNTAQVSRLSGPIANAGPKWALLLLLCGATGALYAQTLGTYPATTVIAGRNTTVTPSAAPTGTVRATARTATGFTGILSVDPATGVVQVTDAKQAGTYTVTVTAYGSGTTTATATFALTVSNPCTGLGLFAATLNVSVGSNSRSVAVGDFNGDGKQDIATANANTSGTVSIRLGDGLGGFTGTTEVSVGSEPTSIAVGDFNGDGKQDIATANISSNSVSIRLGDGLGGFMGTTEVSVGSQPTSVAVGDFNGDGFQDIAAANFGSSSVSIRLGDGLGGFMGTTNVSVGGNSFAVAVGDFNGDGVQDIATANANVIAGTVSIRLGNGSGGFTGTTEVSVGNGPRSVAVGDFNGDGKQDIATANNIASGTVSIRLGNGSGGFTGTTNVAVGSQPTSVAVGDFNGDGRQDIAAANGSSASISIRLGDGSGGFTGTTEVSVGSNPQLVAVGDFNGDGRQDIATANQAVSGTVSIRLGSTADANVRGNGQNIADGDMTPSATDHTDFGTVFSSPLARTFTIQNVGTANLVVSSITSSNPTIFAIGTLTPAIPIVPGNSATFTVTFSPTAVGVQNATITINSNDCDEAAYDFAVTGTVPQPTLGTYQPTMVMVGQNTTVTPGDAPSWAVRTTASTATGFTGILSVDPFTGVVRVTGAKQAGTYTVTVTAFNGGGTATTTFPLTVTNPNCGQLTAPTNLTVGSSPYSVAVGDFNGDGVQDIAIADLSPSGAVLIRLGDGSGGFTGTTQIAVGTFPRSVVVGDFNGDGAQDIATVHDQTSTVSILLGDGLGGFAAPTNVTAGLSPISVAVGDFNGDGKQDIAAANANASGTVSIRLGDGSGGFTGTTSFAVGSNPQSVAVGDFNGDGKQDIATANQNTSGTVSIRLGNGSGGFTGTTEVSVGSNPISVAIGDFNGDGKQDIATANYNLSGTVSIRLGDGSGGFTGTTEVSVGNRPSAVSVSDFNGDGVQDIVTANTSSHSVSILLGNGSGTFTGATNFAVGTNPTSVAVGDFNGDGVQDFATANSTSSSVSIGLGGINDINVQGNGQNITNGDMIPSTADHTDFGTVSTSPPVRTFTIQNTTGTAPLTVSSIVSSNPTIFVIGTLTPANPIPAGQSASFTVTFVPTAAGAQNATITINSNNCDDAAYGFAVTAIAPPPPTIGTYPSTTVIAGQNTTVTPSAAPTGTFRATARTATGFTGVLSVDPATGVVRVTGAKQAGTYTVTVTAYGTATATATFTLTVSNPNCGQGLFTGTTEVVVGDSPASVAVGDFNRDGVQDIAAANRISNSVSIRLGNGSGGFTGTTSVLVGSRPRSVAVGDFNGDGMQDIATANQNTSGTVSIRLGNGLGGFTGTTNVSVGSNPFSVAVGDFNGDGVQDIATANNNASGTVSIRLGDGMGGFTGTTNISVGNNPISVAVGDFNGDGVRDIVTANNIASGTVSIRLGDGSGGFMGTTEVSVGGNPQSVAVGDFNGDGMQDIATANNSASGTVSIRLGDGMGGFTGTTNVLVGSNPISVAVGDFNGDGMQDIATANNTASGTVSIRLGDGSGGFTGTTEVSVGNSPSSVAVGDFNGDGAQDIATANQISSGRVSIRLGASLTPTVSIAAAPSGAICAGASVTFTATAGSLGGGSVSTYNFKVNGSSVQSGASNTYTTNGLANGNTVTCDITVTGSACLASTTASSNTITIAITSPVTPTVSIAATPSGAICTGAAVTFTATAGNLGGGLVSIYDFKVNGSSVQSGASNTYTTNGLANGNTVTCDITVTDGSCLTGTTASSNTVTMTVNASVTPTVSIAAAPSGAICAGTSVTFTATAGSLGGGSVSVYDFKVNGSSVQSGASNTYTTNGLVNGNTVTCDITVTGSSCLASTVASSNTITMAVTSPVTPTVNIAAAPSGAICAGAAVTFTATAGNLGGGLVSIYDFKVNGSSVQSGASNTYTTNGLANGNTVTCDITVTDGNCLTGTTASSNTVTMTVNASVTPTVSIAAAPSGAICLGTAVTFTATAGSLGGGSVSVYDFKVNGSSVQSGASNTYTTNGLMNGNTVTCDITVTGSSCLASTVATSNTITMAVTSPVTPTVNIAAAPSGAICAGTSVTFTATAGNLGGGSVSVYNFKINGSSVQSGASNTYTTNGLANGNTVTCDITVAGGCATNTTASSNTIIMTVNPSATPTVSIGAAPSGAICAGTAVTFTATPGNLGGGSVSVYNFKINGSSVQSGASNTYTTSGLANGNTVTCDITVAGGTCLTSTTASSNTVAMTVNPSATPTVSIAAAPSGAICTGAQVTFTATAGNLGGGSVSIYNFKINGSSVQSGASNTYTTNGLANGNIVTCDITVAGGNCLTSTTAASNTVVMTVNGDVPPTVSIAAVPSGPICAGISVTFTATAQNPGGGSVSVYDFKVNGASVQSGASNTYTTNGLVNGNTVTCDISVAGGCATSTTATSNVIAITGAAPVTPTVSIAAAPLGAICGGTPVTFTATAGNLGGGSVSVYNFKVNGISVQSGASNTYATSSLANGNTVTCDITVAGGCVTSTAASSNAIVMTVTTTDTQAPTITCPVQQVRNTDNNACTAVATYANPTVLDNCTANPAVAYRFSGATTTAAYAAGTGSGATFNKGSTTITLRATDNVGLTRTCTFRIIVNDGQAPSFTFCPPNQTLSTASTSCTSVVTYATPTATDNCSPAPVVVRTSGPASGSALLVGTTQVIWRATDGVSRTATCVFTVTVTDNTPPVIICPAHITVSGSGTPCQATVFYATPTATDNCDVQNLFLQSGLGSGSNFPAGTAVSVWRATDASGTTTTCSVSVTVNCSGSRGTAEPRSADGSDTKPGQAQTTRALPQGWDFALAPNPAQTAVLLSVWASPTAEKTEDGQVLLYDAQGRLLHQQALSEGEQTLRLDVSHWPTGMYWVAMRREGKTVAKKLMIDN